MHTMAIRQLANSGCSIFDMDIRVAFYARVSTEKSEQLNSLTNQKQYFTDFINNNSHWTFAGGYIDEGLSATSVYKRENFLRMIEDAKAGKFDLIITKEISRFSRNTLDSIQYTRQLLSYGIGVFFQNDNINTLDNDAELRLTIMASLAQDEVRKLSERTRFGFKRSQENGRLLGKNNLYGYDKHDGRLFIIEDEAVVVRKFFLTYIEGKLGLRGMANSFEAEGIVNRAGKPFTASTISGILRNPKYKGYYAGNRYTSMDYRDKRKINVAEKDWIVFKDEKIPAIVNEDIWDTANRLLLERGKVAREHSNGHSNRYTYSGKIICGEHGTTYHRTVLHSKRRGDVECWNCRLYRLKGKDNGCDSPTVYSYELDEILSRVYKDMFSHKDRIIDEYLSDLEAIQAEDDCQTELESVQKQISSLERKKEKLLELSMDDAITNQEFRQRNDKLNQKIGELETRIEGLKEEIIKNANSKAQISKLRAVLEEQWNDNAEYNCEVTGVVLDRIVVNKIGDKTHLKLDIFLKFGEAYTATLTKERDNNYIISLSQMNNCKAQAEEMIFAELIYS